MNFEIEKLRKEKLKAEAKGQWKDAGTLCNFIGQELYKLAKYEDALCYHNEELEYCTMLSDELGKAVANRKIGECYSELSNFKKALYHQKIFLNIAVQQKSSVEEQRAWATLGRTYYLKCLQETRDASQDVYHLTLNKAEQSFLKALKLSELLKSEISVKEHAEMKARLLLNIGLVYELRNNLNKCAESIRHAIFLTKKFSLYEDLHRCQYSLATVYQRCEQYNFALRLLDESISTAKLLRDKTLICEAMYAKANILLLLKDFSGCKTYLKKAYKLHSPITSDHEKNESYLKVAICLTNCEQKLLTVKDPHQRKHLFEKMADGLAYVDCYKLAVEYYFTTLKCLEEINASSSEKSAIYYSLAQTYEDDGKYAEALIYLEKEFNCNINRPGEQIKTLWKIADIMELKKDNEGNINALVKALSISEELGDSKLKCLSLKRLRLSIEIEGRNNLSPLNLQEINNKLVQLSAAVDFESDDESDLPDTDQKFDDINLDDLTDSTDSDVENEICDARRSRRRVKRLAEKRNEMGETPLHRACISGNLNMVKQLVENKHPVNPRDNCGWLPLHEACNYGHYEIVDYLLTNGAFINDRGGKLCDGITPLHDAATCGSLDVMELLISRKASVTTLTNNGETPLDALIKWRQRTESDLDEGTLEQCRALERQLRTLMKMTGQNDLEENTDPHDEHIMALHEESVNSDVEEMLGRAAEKRMHSSSSSSDDNEIYNNPHLDRKNEGDLNYPKQADSEYKAVMSSIRRSGKQVNPTECNLQNSPKPALLEVEVVRDWLISDTNKKSKSLKKKQRRMRQMNSRIRNHSMDQYLNKQDSDSDNLSSVSPRSSIDRTNYESNDDDSNVSNPSLLNAHEDQRASTEKCATLFCLRVKITDKMILVPVTNDSCSIGWLAEEASNRFQDLVGKRPHLQLMNKDGALLSSADLIKMVLHKNEEVSTSVLFWDQPSLLEHYKQNCKRNNVLVSQPLETRLQVFESSTELNFSDICLPSSQLAMLLSSLEGYKTLSHLNLSNNDLEEVLTQFIACFPSFVSLEHLNLSCCGLTSANLEKMTTSLSERPSFAGGFSKLRQLYLNYNLFSAGAAQSFSTLLNLPLMEVFEAKSCGITEDFLLNETVGNVLSSKVNLKELDVSHNWLNDTGISKLLKILPKNSLEKLNLSRTTLKNIPFGQYLLSYFSVPMTRLVEISLEACYLTDDDILFLCEGLKFCPKLSFINISCNPGLNSTVLLQLVQACREHEIPLEALHAVMCFRWDNSSVNNFCKLLHLGTLKRLLVDALSEEFHERLSLVWREIWGDRALCCNDFLFELGVDRLLIQKC